LRIFSGANGIIASCQDLRGPAMISRSADRHEPRRIGPVRALLAAAAAAAAIGLAAAPVAVAQAPAAAVRVDQLGFASTESKVAYLLTPHALANAPFSVVDASGVVVLNGTAGPSRGRWNARYGAVQPLDLTALTTPGTYRIEVAGPPAAESPPFAVGSPAACPEGGGDALKPFSGHGSRFVDSVSAWQTVEPAIDFDAAAALAFALSASS
jgi:Cellulase N-terminal ig-like domain